MDECPHISPPSGEDDTDGAFRVFEEFFVIYQPTFLQVERYLEKAMHEMAPVYAEAYRPWYKAVHDLLRGVLLTSNHSPVPDSEAFLEAMKIFSFDSAIQFLNDICVTCQLKLEKDWAEHFREHINTLLVSNVILHPEQPV